MDRNVFTNSSIYVRYALRALEVVQRSLLYYKGISIQEDALRSEYNSVGYKARREGD